MNLLTAQYNRDVAIIGFLSQRHGFRQDFLRMILFLVFAVTPLFAQSSSDNSEPCDLVLAIKDPNLLAKTALDENENRDVRIQAVNKLTDQGLLAKVAMEVPIAIPLDGKICIAAISNLTDQSLLAKVAIEAKDTNIRVHAVAACKSAIERLSDQSLLAKVAADARESDIRVAAVNKLTDKALLEKAAVEFVWPDARKAAVEKLNEQTLLAKIAVEDKSWLVQLTAAKKVTNQPLLAEVLAQNEHVAVQSVAVRNLSDKKLLAEFCDKHENRTADIACLKLFLDHPLVISKFGKLSMEFGWELNSQWYQSNYGQNIDVFGEQLRIVVVADSHVKVNEYSSTRFPEELPDNPDFLSADADISSVVAQLLKDSRQPELAKLAVEDRYSLVRLAAVKHLEDKVLLERIATQDPSERVRAAAKTKLK